MKAPSGIAIVGTGKLGRALLRALSEAGVRPLRVLSRRTSRARAVARRIPGVEAALDPRDAVAASRVVVFAVPDSVLPSVAESFASEASSWRGRVALHAAGSLGAPVLEPLVRAGASVGVLHPFQALGEPERGASLLRGAWARIEGSPVAVREARRLAKRVGLVPFAFRATGADPGTYHAAASLASNDLLALLCAAERTLVRAGARKRDARQAVSAIASATVDQFLARGAAAATGPVVRGDAPTVARQLAALGSADRSAAAIHALLSEWILRNASALPEASRRRLRRVLTRGRTARGAV